MTPTASQKREDAAVDAAATLVRERLGLRADGPLRARLARAVASLAEAHGVDRLALPGLARERTELAQELCDRVVIHETSFFRDGGQFESLKTHVLPSLRPPVRIWSAGCSTGQEPWSLAMTLDEAGVSDWFILASDVSHHALERASEATYSERELRGLDRARRSRYLTRSAERFAIGEALRERVRFVPNNLLTDKPPLPPQSCQVVFCRYVIIYLERPAAERVLDRIAHWLPPHGILFTGQGEATGHLRTPLRAVRLGDARVHRPDAPESPSPRRPPRPAPSSPLRPAPGPEPADQRPPPTRPTGRTPTPVALPLPTLDELVRGGEEAMRRGDAPAAVRAYRQATYVAPHDPLPHALLGLALEGAGERLPARRAFRAARAALLRAPHGEIDPRLGGFRPGELDSLLEARLEDPT